MLILITIAGMAGAASFTHVHNWTMSNAPAGTGSWFGWANAVISELTPTAAGIEIRRRKRNGHHSVAYPMAILIAAAILSLSAQVAEAQPTLAGWVSSAVPALAFLALTKLILGRPQNKKENEPAWTQPETAATARAKTPASASPATAPAPKTAATPAPSAAFSSRPDTVTITDALRDLVPVPSGQLQIAARMAAFSHQQATGQPITPGQLAERLSIPEPLAVSILDHLDGITPPPAVTAVNGSAQPGSRP